MFKSIEKFFVNLFGSNLAEAKVEGNGKSYSVSDLLQSQGYAEAMFAAMNEKQTEEAQAVNKTLEQLQADFRALSDKFEQSEKAAQQNAELVGKLQETVNTQAKTIGEQEAAISAFGKTVETQNSNIKDIAAKVGKDIVNQPVVVNKSNGVQANNEKPNTENKGIAFSDPSANAAADRLAQRLQSLNVKA